MSRLVAAVLRARRSAERDADAGTGIGLGIGFERGPGATLVAGVAVGRSDSERVPGGTQVLPPQCRSREAWRQARLHSPVARSVRPGRRPSRNCQPASCAHAPSRPEGRAHRARAEPGRAAAKRLDDAEHRSTIETVMAVTNTTRPSSAGAGRPARPPSAIRRVIATWNRRRIRRPSSVAWRPS